MKSLVHVCFAIVMLTLLCITPIAKPTLPPEIDFTELDKLVPTELREKNTPGAVIAVVSGDRVIYQKAFGVANVETNEVMKPEMLFRLGSTTKMFTAAALVKLSEQGKLKLNEPLGNHLKDLNKQLAATTTDHLLSHTAGFRDFAAPFISNDDSALSNMVHSWKGDVLFANPGEIYSYSSPGYWFAGYAVEAIEGKPYADAMTELLFKPLGMERTTLRPFMAITYPFATGHNVEAGHAAIIRPMFNNVAMWPAGSMFSNADDLSRWVIAFLNEGRLEGQQVLSTSLVKEMAVPRVPVPGETDSYYAYGLTAFKYQGLQFVGHGGFSRGYGSMVQMVPERKFAVIVLTNKSGETLRKSLNKALELGLGLKDTEQPKADPVAQLTKSELAEYVGSYSHAPQIWEVSAREDKLFMKYEGKEYPLTRTGEKKFTFGAQNENE